jgi:hypothetical protein
MKRLGAVVLGISKDTIASHKKFAEKFDLPFVLLSDPKAEVMKKYRAFGKKIMYGKTVEGTIRSTLVIGSKGNVIKHWPTVKKADQHPQEVLAFLREQSTRLIETVPKSQNNPVIFRLFFQKNRCRDYQSNPLIKPIGGVHEPEIIFKIERDRFCWAGAGGYAQVESFCEC